MIAISYRREDSTPIAGRVFDRLQNEFGRTNVFMDFDSIPYGVDFREHISETLGRAKALVVIIGPHWSESREGARRLHDSNDFVRLEIRSALERGIAVIPVLVNNAVMPKDAELPTDIEALAFRNALLLDTGVDFHHHIDRLISAIHEFMDPSPRSRRVPILRPSSVDAIYSKRKGRKGIRSITLLAAVVIAVALLGGWWWFTSSHKIPQAQSNVAAPIEGRWLLRVSDAPPDVKPETYMRVQLEGTRLKVFGDSWTGVGSFDGQQGYYDWEFHDGTNRTGSTTIRLDREGYLYGKVSGSNIDWSYWASRQPE
jgi:hypothetical protein